jgi:hypothetical protein
MQESTHSIEQSITVGGMGAFCHAASALNQYLAHDRVRGKVKALSMDSPWWKLATSLTLTYVHTDDDTLLHAEAVIVSGTRQEIAETLSAFDALGVVVLAKSNSVGWLREQAVAILFDTRGPEEGVRFARQIGKCPTLQ